ncbi:MAG: hypothetical protein J6V62_06910, partial [Paludibacteraceae bacterium]|nr:hypothetical protein [Paludibacteraceae bacterium]
HLVEGGNRFLCAKTLSKMCCLSEASSHFVVFVCENPDRKPSRKMKRRPDSPISQKKYDSTS